MKKIYKPKVTKRERGWPGHFWGSPQCIYHRNTLITRKDDDTSIVVSTIGNYRKYLADGYSERITFAAGHHYETKAFLAWPLEKDLYQDIRSDSEISLNPNVEWTITDTKNWLTEIDLKADALHDKACHEIKFRLKHGESFNKPKERGKGE